MIAGDQGGRHSKAGQEVAAAREALAAAGPKLVASQVACRGPGAQKTIQTTVRCRRDTQVLRRACKQASCKDSECNGASPVA